MNEIKDQSITTKALAKIYQNGGTDGAHHKQWLLDQVVRILCETEDGYNTWVNNFESGEYGPDTYKWDVGIPP